MKLKITNENRKWWILSAMTSCISMIFIDVTVLPVTLPTIQRLLGLSELSLQWIVNVYTFALTVFVLAGGRLSDRLGHKKGFCLGLLFFLLGSVLSAFSFSAPWFIGSRIIQGLGAALLLPSSSAVIVDSFAPHERGKALGLYVSVGSIFLALGPFIGGLFSEFFSWRLVFWINVPIGALGFILTMLSLPSLPGKYRSFDAVGFLMTSVGISALLFPFMHAKQAGSLWASSLTPLNLGLFSLGALCFLLLYFWDRKVEDPYIDFSFFKNRAFLGSMVIVFTTQFLMMVTIFWAIYFQNIQGYTPMQAGLLSLVANVPIMIAAPIGGHLLDKYGPRLPIAIGFGLILISLLWFLQVLDTTNLFYILAAVIPFGCGIPLIMTPSFTMALSQVAPERRGLASAMVTMLRQFGATLGLAILGSLFLTIQQSQMHVDLQQNKATSHLHSKELQGILSKAPKAMEHIEHLPQTSQTFVIESARASYLKSFWTINAVSASIAFTGLCFSLWINKRAAKKC